VIAPYHADQPEDWQRVWDFDLQNGIISIGWRELGDVSKLSKQELSAAIQDAYPDKPANIQSLYTNMIWSFYHEVKPGDVIIARKGIKCLAAVGDVKEPAYYDSSKIVESVGQEIAYSNHLDVQWRDSPRNLDYENVVFGRMTLYEIDAPRYQEFVEGFDSGQDEFEGEGVEDKIEFILEKYLEDFIVSNFNAIFGPDLSLYRDSGDEIAGQQYNTGEVGVIDILAEDQRANDIVVIELKKGRESDRVLGQILRYMGWVAENLATEGQNVRGIIICKDSDPKLLYALSMAQDVSVKYYEVDFTLHNEQMQ
jgi:restriction system protein